MKNGPDMLLRGDWPMEDTPYFSRCHEARQTSARLRLWLLANAMAYDAAVTA